jgi:hypothetical protein
MNEHKEKRLMTFGCIMRMCNSVVHFFIEVEKSK